MTITPGPWNVCERWPYQPDGLHFDWERLQTVWIVGKRPGVALAAVETEADARLIAAAPDMHDVLTEVSAILHQRHQDGWESRLLGIIDAVLSKAGTV